MDSLGTGGSRREGLLPHLLCSRRSPGADEMSLNRRVELRCFGHCLCEACQPYSAMPTCVLVSRGDRPSNFSGMIDRPGSLGGLSDGHTRVVRSWSAWSQSPLRQTNDSIPGCLAPNGPLDLFNRAATSEKTNIQLDGRGNTHGFEPHAQPCQHIWRADWAPNFPTLPPPFPFSCSRAAALEISLSCFHHCGITSRSTQFPRSLYLSDSEEP